LDAPGESRGGQSDTAAIAWTRGCHRNPALHAHKSRLNSKHAAVAKLVRGPIFVQNGPMLEYVQLLCNPPGSYKPTDMRPKFGQDPRAGHLQSSKFPRTPF